MRCLLIESRAKNARRHRVSDAKPPLQNLTEAMGVFKCKASASDRRPSPRQKASSTGKPSARFPTVEGGLVPIACGADSVASALHPRLGATPRGPSQTIITLRAGRSKAELLTLHKTGTSHFALTHTCATLTFEMSHDIYERALPRIGRAYLP